MIKKQNYLYFAGFIRLFIQVFSVPTRGNHGFPIHYNLCPVASIKNE